MPSHNTSTFAAALATLSLVACGGASSPAETSSPAPSPAADIAAPAQDTISIATLRTATFTGQSDHVTTGRVSIAGADGTYTLVFAEDFSLDGAPDPVVGFGNNGTYDPTTKLGALINKTGAQSYPLPEGLDPRAYGEVYVWCEQFDVPLGVASFPSTVTSGSTGS
ncbi:MAG: DM13 domain-containing protein [Pseudomonadota bacterium]